MLRSIETSYFMSKIYNPSNIFVFPHLRECYQCNENDYVIGKDKLTNVEKKMIDWVFPLKSIENQKEYLYKNNINNVNFKYVENNPLRDKYGDIKTFIEWFGKNIELPKKQTVDSINVLIITHSIVMGKFLNGGGTSNNTGFILKTRLDENKNIFYSKNDIISIFPKTNFLKFNCSTRCIELCSKQDNLAKIGKFLKKFAKNKKV